jgi:hypothetical protein
MKVVSRGNLSTYDKDQLSPSTCSGDSSDEYSAEEKSPDIAQSPDIAWATATSHLHRCPGEFSSQVSQYLDNCLGQEAGVDRKESKEWQMPPTREVSPEPFGHSATPSMIRLEEHVAQYGHVHANMDSHLRQSSGEGPLRRSSPNPTMQAYPESSAYQAWMPVMVWTGPDTAQWVGMQAMSPMPNGTVIPNTQDCRVMPTGRVMSNLMPNPVTNTMSNPMSNHMSNPTCMQNSGATLSYFQPSPMSTAPHMESGAPTMSNAYANGTQVQAPSQHNAFISREVATPCDAPMVVASEQSVGRVQKNHNVQNVQNAHKIQNVQNVQSVQNVQNVQNVKNVQKVKKVHKMKKVKNLKKEQKVQNDNVQDVQMVQKEKKVHNVHQVVLHLKATGTLFSSALAPEVPEASREAQCMKIYDLMKWNGMTNPKGYLILDIFSELCKERDELYYVIVWPFVQNRFVSLLRSAPQYFTFLDNGRAERIPRVAIRSEVFQPSERAVDHPVIQ